jgi:hypothetical protein
MLFLVAVWVKMRFNLAEVGQEATIAPTGIADGLSPEVIVCFLASEPTTYSMQISCQVKFLQQTTILYSPALVTLLPPSALPA